MKLISARSSCAPGAHEHGEACAGDLVARSKSRMPSAGPRSQCAFGSKSNWRGSPHVRTTALSAALCPDRHALVRQIRESSAERVALMLDGIELDARAA